MSDFKETIVQFAVQPTKYHKLMRNAGAVPLSSSTNEKANHIVLTQATADSFEWERCGADLVLMHDNIPLRSIPVDEAFPIGPVTIEHIENLRSTPFFKADIVLHLLSFLVEHDMELQEYLDERYLSAAQMTAKSSTASAVAAESNTGATADSPHVAELKAIFGERKKAAGRKREAEK